MHLACDLTVCAPEPMNSPSGWLMLSFLAMIALAVGLTIGKMISRWLPRNDPERNEDL